MSEPTVDINAAFRAWSYETLCKAYLELKAERDEMARRLDVEVSL